MDKRARALLEVQGLARGAQEKVRNFFGIQLSYPIAVALNSGEMLAKGLLPWAKSGLRGKIIVRYPQITSEQIAHEMSHFSLRALSKNKPIPIWFDEGLACYLGEASMCGGEAELKEMLMRSSIPDITGWVGTKGKCAWLFRMYVKGETRVIYGLSLYMVKGLVEKHGIAKLQSLVGRLNSSDFNAAFLTTYGMPVKDYYASEVIKAF